MGRYLAPACMVCLVFRSTDRIIKLGVLIGAWNADYEHAYTQANADADDHNYSQIYKGLPAAENG